MILCIWETGAWHTSKRAVDCFHSTRLTGSQSSVNAFLQILPKSAGVESDAMPLKLSLKPGETFVVNGAVVRNGERRGVLLLETRARVLREKDILRPTEATTQAGRAYFAINRCFARRARCCCVRGLATATSCLVPPVLSRASRRSIRRSRPGRPLEPPTS